jgi:hypothetical protein
MTLNAMVSGGWATTASRRPAALQSWVAYCYRDTSLMTK